MGSYDTMDHVGWVEANGKASKRMAKKPKKDKHGLVVGWHAMPEKLTRFQGQVVTICGIAMGGIYNANIAWNSVDWGDRGSDYMRVPLNIPKGLSTHDFQDLTTLVLLAHMARIRLEVEAGAPRCLTLSFWQRSHQGSQGSEAHPSIQERLVEYLARFPADHRVHYRPDLDDPLPARWRGTLERLAGANEQARLDELLAKPRSAFSRQTRADFFRSRGFDLKHMGEQWQRDMDRAAELAASLLTPEAAAQAEAVKLNRACMITLLGPHMEENERRHQEALKTVDMEKDLERAEVRMREIRGLVFSRWEKAMLAVSNSRLGKMRAAVAISRNEIQDLIGEAAGLAEKVAAYNAAIGADALLVERSVAKMAEEILAEGARVSRDLSKLADEAAEKEKGMDP